MAEVKKPARSAAEIHLDRVFNAAIDASIAEEPTVPNGTAFMAVDSEREVKDLVARQARDGLPTLLVFDDGEQILLTPTKHSR